MPLFALVAKDRAGAAADRQAVRPRHLQHLDELGDKLVLAGPFQDEAGKSTGSLVVVEAESLEAAKALFDRDPFIAAGVFESWEISRFSLTLNNSAGR